MFIPNEFEVLKRTCALVKHLWLCITVLKIMPTCYGQKGLFPETHWWKHTLTRGRSENVGLGWLAGEYWCSWCQWEHKLTSISRLKQETELKKVCLIWNNFNVFHWSRVLFLVGLSHMVMRGSRPFSILMFCLGYYKCTLCPSKIETSPWALTVVVRKRHQCAMHQLDKREYW